MPYATSEHIQSEFKDLDLSKNTKITPEEVRRFIEETDAEINSVVGLIYAVPVTGTESVKFLRTICIDIVVDRIKFILGVKSGVEEADQGEGGSRADKARERLGKIPKKELILTDAEAARSGGAVSSYNVSAGVEHNFKRNVPQW